MREEGQEKGVLGCVWRRWCLKEGGRFAGSKAW